MKNLIFLFISFQIFSAEAGVQNGAVVFVYHHVSNETPDSTSISPELFKKHLEYLDKNGFSVWSLDKIGSYVKDGKTFPPKIVGLSFDDGYHSVYKTAWPLLQKYKMPFTVFVSTKFIGEKPGAYFSWGQLVEMYKSGVLIGNHTHSHQKIEFSLDRKKSERYIEEFFQDISKAQHILDDKLKSPPVLFAYPFGEFSNEMKESLVRKTSLFGYSQLSGPIGGQSEIAALTRFPMNNHFGKMSEFKQKVSMVQLPIVSYEPSATVREAKEFTLQAALEIDAVPMDRIKCYSSSGDKLNVRMDSKIKNTFRVRSGVIKQKGRHKINCTALHQGKTYWYSFLWILV